MAKPGPQDVTKLTSEEIEAKLKANQAQLDEAYKRAQEKAIERNNALKERQTANLDVLIEAMEETEDKIADAKEQHATQCERLRKRPAAVEQADRDLRAKLAEYQAALNLLRKGLELPYGCPFTLTEVKVFKEQHIKREQEAATNAKVSAEESKRRAQQYKIQDDLQKLQLEKTAREEKAKLEITKALDKKLVTQADKNYGVWHKTLGAAVAIALYFVFSPAIPMTAAAMAMFCATAMFGASVGQAYRNSVINAGKIYRSKEDIANIEDWSKPRLAEKIAALKQGVEAASWKGYFTSFGNSEAFNHPTEFKAGMIQAITQNDEVVKAIRNR